VRLKSGRSGVCRKVERHIGSKNTERWPELSAQHEARYTGEGRNLAIRISKTSGEVDVLYQLAVRVSGQRSDRSVRRYNHVGISPVSCSAVSCIPHFSVHVAGQQHRKPTAETGVQFRSE
jgi:hypothetical protein